MSDMRVSDPSKLHLKKELTQIRKAARALRDPGTTSSWKSPLSSSRSVAAISSAVWKGNCESDTRRLHENSPLESHFSLPSGDNSNGGKEKRVFLYNWKNQKSSCEKSTMPKNDVDEDEDDGGNDVSSLLESFEDSLSDARNGGGDSKSDSYLGGESRSSILRCRDANLILSTPSSGKREMWGKKKFKKNQKKLGDLSRYKQRDATLGRNFVNSKTLLEGHRAIGLSKGESVEQSDETEEYSYSEDLRRIAGASPPLLKLKRKNWSHASGKFLRTSIKEDSSYSYSTPALSTSSFNRYGHRNPSTIGSWDGTATSVNDGDDEIDDQLDLPGRHGCGIPCYWSKRSTPKHKGLYGSCYSPSLSDTIRRKGSSILCGSQTINSRRRRSVPTSNKRRIATRSAQGVLPLLTNSADGRGSSLDPGESDDELSTNFGELELEALSRLDGRRWSTSCRSEGLDIIALNGEGDDDGTPDNIRSFSQKYKPMFFSELVGQNIVVQSLINAVARARIAAVYLFQGPRGTGKTSTARIFAAALNCMAPDENKPCGYCMECTEFISGKSKDLIEVDGKNKKSIDRVRQLLKKLAVVSSSSSSRFLVFVIDECHLLSSKTWLALLKSLEEPPRRVVFIFITTDLDNVPRTIQSRCQKYIFNKIKDGDIVARLRKISADESLDVEPDALELIAVNADGSLRDAETMLEQLSLLGKRVTTSLVNELVGVVSDEKLLELLELAMSSDTAETVKRAREIMDSGVDPMVLMSQLASLIMDIIAGTYNMCNNKYGDLLFGGRGWTESEIERLKHALKLLSEAEKQLRRISTERSTWFTATLLHLGSMPSPDASLSSSSRRQSCKIENDPPSATREAAGSRQKVGVQSMPRQSISPASMQNVSNVNFKGDLLSKSDGFEPKSRPATSSVVNGGSSAVSGDESLGGNMYRCVDMDKLYDIWALCIERCHSKTLRQLLHTHGKLVSICEVEGIMVAYIAFENVDIKLRAERFLSSITNSVEMVLRRNVDVRIIHLPRGEASANGENVASHHSLKQSDSTMGNGKELQVYEGGKDTHPSFPSFRGGKFPSGSDSSELWAEGISHTLGARDRKQDIPMQRIESIILEQRLETAWLQAVEKGTPGSLNRLRPEKNQVLPQDGVYYKDQMESMESTRFSSQHWEDELNHELKVLNVNSGNILPKDKIGRRADRFTMSPSLLHNNSLATSSGKDNPGYESGSGNGGCSGFFCWNNSKPSKRVKVKGTPIGRHRSGRFSLFGECGGKAKKKHSRELR